MKTSVLIALPAFFWDWLCHLSPHQWMVLSYLALHSWGSDDPCAVLSIAEMESGLMWNETLRADSGLPFSAPQLSNILRTLEDIGLVWQQPHTPGLAAPPLFGLNWDVAARNQD